jgi:hypothetical protein
MGESEAILPANSEPGEITVRTVILLNSLRIKNLKRMGVVVGTVYG